MNYQRILRHLYSLESSKIGLGLKNIKALLKKLGNPEKELKSIHVAGTNGKGSVCAMLFYILRQAGYNVGLYTSPHLKKFNERIRLNDNFISDREIVEYYLRIKDSITNQSFFEITTAIAFLYFKDNKADFVILEVGLGGRLDATNVVKPLVSVITTIGLEHTALLGNIVEKIAYEKAGIIKENVPIVTGAGGAALNTIKRIAKEKNAPLILVKPRKKIKFKYLNGRFQQFNASVALATIDTLKKYCELEISNKDIGNGLKNAKWPARLEFIGKNVLVDCAHNPDGMAVLADEIKSIMENKNFENLIFIFGALKDKNVVEMLRKILELKLKLMIFTEANSDRALSVQELEDIFAKLNNKIFHKSIKKPKDALEYARKIAEKDELIAAAGSMYMVGEII